MPELKPRNKNEISSHGRDNGDQSCNGSFGRDNGDQRAKNNQVRVMENVIVGNATKVSFVLLVTLITIIPCLKTGIGEFDNFLKAQTKKAYKITLNAYVPTLEDVTNKLNLHLQGERDGRVTIVSNSSDVAYGFNCNGMFRGCTIDAEFTK
ncbi:hypothetical protein CR513_40260, partial [Mucuna pruriens]